MKQTQLIKGVLEGCVLAIVSQDEVYGYELIQSLHQHGFTTIAGGTLYPLLIKLEKNGALISKVKPSKDGPDRKYYSITPQGLQEFREFNQQWFQLKNHVDKILKEMDDK